nr:HNH endonuclease family protein [Pseudohongiella sp. O18]
MVPLQEAHNSGAYSWDAGRREAFANDLVLSKALIAVSASANRSKGARDPAEWLPTNASHRCDYVKNWMEVKRRYGLEIDSAEREAIEAVLGAPISAGSRLESAGWDEIKRQSSSAVFGLGVRKLSQCAYSSQVSPSDQIQITVSVLPDRAHIGQRFDIFLVADIPAGLFSIDPAGRFTPFNGDVASLVPFQDDVYLRQSQEVSVFTGALNDELVMNLFIGYATEGGDFVYTGAPLPLRVTDN